jgi:hypothetical protein
MIIRVGKAPSRNLNTVQVSSLLVHRDWHGHGFYPSNLMIIRRAAGPAAISLGQVPGPARDPSHRRARAWAVPMP